MELPAAVAAYGWIPFVVVLLLTVFFSWLYIRFFQSTYEKEVATTVTATLALTVTLLTTFLIPVDVFLISYMKYDNGTFKPWAENDTVRQSYETTVLYGYYALYGCIMLFLFFIIPFTYFFYEENDDEPFTQSLRVCTACRYTVFFVLLVGVLLVLGAFIPLKSPPSQNITDWEKIEFLFFELEKNKGEDALSFVLSILSLLGLVILIFYTGFGMAALPCTLIKGTRSLQVEEEECVNRKLTVEARINSIKDNYRNGRPMRSRDKRMLEALEDENRLMERQANYIDRERNSWGNKCSCIFRPFQITFGIIFGLLGFLIFLSLLLTSIDKAMNSLGYSMGFVLVQPKLPNPIDLVFVYAQLVFPLDYILFFGIVMFFLFASMCGIRQMGIWFLWIRLYKIRPHRTRPQGLLLLCVTLMFIILAVNVILYTLLPQYSMYGSQHFQDNTTAIVRCSTAAPLGECDMSRMSSILTRFFYKAWFFGICYYGAVWLFLLAIIIGAIVSIFRKPVSSLDGAPSADDFEESDEELLTP